MSSLQEKISAAIQQSRANFNKFASDVDSAETKTPAVAETGSPEELQGSAASDVIVDGTPLIGDKGEAKPEPLKTTEGGVDASLVETNNDGEAASALDIENGKITEEDIDVINKAANVIRAVGARLLERNAFDNMNKQASAEDDAVTLMYKRASAGDTAAQACLDWMSSFELGMAKKANDMQEAANKLGATDENDLSAIEDALNAQAMETPELLEGEGDEEISPDVEEILNDPELMEVLQEAGAELEGVMAEEIDTVAQEIMAEDPEIGEDEAYEAAQQVVADAVETMDAQQLIGAVDENGEPVVDDETAAAAVDNMAKTASDYPLRDYCVARMNYRLGLSPEAFATRVFGE